MSASEAIVLVGGLGTRLRKVVSDVPKPLAPVAGRPFLAWVLDHLADAGIRRTILATGYMADKVEQAIGRDWGGMEIRYSVEDEPLGTGGAIRNALALLAGNSVHVLNGDTFLDYAPAGLEAATRDAGAALGIALAQVQDTARYGAVRLDQSRIVGFSEKGEQGPGWINAGCYYLTERALSALPETSAFSLEKRVLEPLATAGQAIGYTLTSRFIDIGVPDDYARAQALLAQ